MEKLYLCNAGNKIISAGYAAVKLLLLWEEEQRVLPLSHLSFHAAPQLWLCSPSRAFVPGSTERILFPSAPAPFDSLPVLHPCGWSSAAVALLCPMAGVLLPPSLSLRCCVAAQLHLSSVGDVIRRRGPIIAPCVARPSVRFAFQGDWKCRLPSHTIPYVFIDHSGIIRVHADRA